MPAGSKFLDAQRQVLVRLEGCEMAICELYTALAVRLPDMAEFWDGLAHEERGHALMLRSMNRFLDQGHLFQDLGRFDLGKFHAFVQRVRSDLDAIGHGQLTPERALSMALACERSTVESGFFHVVTSDAPEYQTIARHLDQAEREHARLIERCLGRLTERAAAAALPSPPPPGLRI